MTIGQALRILRYRKGWTSERVALKINYSKSNVDAVKAGTLSPTYDKLLLFAKAFDVRPSSIALLAEALEGKEPEANSEIEELVNQIIKDPTTCDRIGKEFRYNRRVAPW